MPSKATASGEEGLSKILNASENSECLPPHLKSVDFPIKITYSNIMASYENHIQISPGEGEGDFMAGTQWPPIQINLQ